MTKEKTAEGNIERAWGFLITDKLFLPTSEGLGAARDAQEYKNDDNYNNSNYNNGNKKETSGEVPRCRVRAKLSQHTQLHPKSRESRAGSERTEAGKPPKSFRNYNHLPPKLSKSPRKQQIHSSRLSNTDFKL